MHISPTLLNVLGHYNRKGRDDTPSFPKRLRIYKHYPSSAADHLKCSIHLMEEFEFPLRLQSSHTVVGPHNRRGHIRILRPKKPGLEARSIVVSGSSVRKFSRGCAHSFTLVFEPSIISYCVMIVDRYEFNHGGVKEICDYVTNRRMSVHDDKDYKAVPDAQRIAA